MTYDKPAQVVWVANLTATGYVNSTFLKIVDNTSPIINIVDKYTDTGYLNSSLSNYFLNTKILYTITDNNFNENLSSFVWNFSGYKGPVYSSTAMLAVNYFNNNTANNIEIIINYNTQTISPPFYIDPYDPSIGPSDSKSFIVPAGAKNFPIPLWVKPSYSNNTKTFTCLLCATPSVIINGTAAFLA
jgi:hypothetical protein